MFPEAPRVLWGGGQDVVWLIRRLNWVDARDMLADGLTLGGSTFLLHAVSNGEWYVSIHLSLVHNTAGSATLGPGTRSDVGFEYRNSSANGPVVGFERPSSAVVCKEDNLGE